MKGGACMSQFTAPINADWGQLGSALVPGAKEGSDKPWLCVVKPYTWTRDANAWPFYGLPSFAYVAAGQVLIKMIPIASMIDAGLTAVSSAPHFLKALAESNEKQSNLLYEDGSTALIKEKECIFIPFGLMPFVPAAPPTDAEGDEKWHAKVIVTTTFQQLGQDVAERKGTDMIKQSITASLQANSGSATWKGPQQCLEAWVQA